MPQWFYRFAEKISRWAFQLRKESRPAAFLFAPERHDNSCERQKHINSPVQARRLAREWSQAKLAERAGILRAAVSAIEGERLSPSVATALALAAMFECSVEELFGRGGISKSHGSQSAWKPRGESSRYWEAEIGQRRLLNPVEAMTLNPTPHDGVWQNGGLRASGSATETPLKLEKVFDELKNKLGEKKAWATSLDAKQTHAHLLTITHNLLLLYEQALAVRHAVQNQAEGRGKLRSSDRC